MKIYFILSFMLLTGHLAAQDLPYAKEMVDTLTSRTLWGRGYTNNGMDKAANFIVSEFKAYGLQPMDGKSYKQAFSFSVNTFPGKMEVAVNGKTLNPGKDFIVMPESLGQSGSGKLEQKDSITFIDSAQRMIVLLKDKLTWSVAQLQENYTGIEVFKTAISGKPQQISIDIQNSFVQNFETANICGIVKGTRNPDSVVVFTAHYDHLGGMGSDTYFPGANDNASGIAFLLSLAKYYAANPQPYSIAFICFAAEEAGLVGSKYFTEHPLLPLEAIRFLINVDMVGTGEKGITVVNATEHLKEFALLNKINDEKKYLSKINSRGKAANSDHYFFAEKGVPAFFIYTQGGIDAYHDVNDVAKTLPLTEFEDLFRLLRDWLVIAMF
ncbi:MAG: M28 family peptidase [Pedobacter sp.]|nr:MAG: M28 family peptidase [Pedobacter sp.]